MVGVLCIKTLFVDKVNKWITVDTFEYVTTAAGKKKTKHTNNNDKEIAVHLHFPRATQTNFPLRHHLLFMVIEFFNYILIAHSFSHRGCG